ncbi:MAG: KH domain-containing protein [Solirubrobacterales bacterium]
MTELLEFLVKALVEDPEAVVVEEFEEDGDLVYEVTVAEEDRGRVIGRHGRVANAIRTIAKAAAVRLDRRVVVEIVD